MPSRILLGKMCIRDRSSLAVTENYILNAHFLEHKSRNFACESTALCPVAVFGTDFYPAGQLKDKTTTDNTSGFRELLKRAAKKENEEQDH